MSWRLGLGLVIGGLWALALFAGADLLGLPLIEILEVLAPLAFPLAASLVLAYAAAYLMHRLGGLWWLSLLYCGLALPFLFWGAAWILTPQRLSAIAVGTVVLLVPYGTSTLVGYVGGSRSMGTDGERFFRGLLIGLNAVSDFLFAAVIYSKLLVSVLGRIGNPLAIGVAVLVGTASLLAAVAPTNHNAKATIGWLGLLMPTAWPVIGLGVLLFFLSHLGNVLFSWLPIPIPGWIPVVGGTTVGTLFSVNAHGVRIVEDRAPVVTVGGICGNLNPIRTAYSLGAFIFVSRWLSSASTASTIGTTQHEVGHHLNLGAFGQTFHWIGWIEEMVPGSSSSGSFAYAEQLAESNVSSPSGPSQPMWN
jgi:hypothetical protein